MNIMMVAASAGQGINPTLPMQEGALFVLFLGVAGLALLSVGGALLLREHPHALARYTRSRRGPNGL